MSDARRSGEGRHGRTKRNTAFVRYSPPNYGYTSVIRKRSDRWFGTAVRRSMASPGYVLPLVVAGPVRLQLARDRCPSMARSERYGVTRRVRDGPPKGLTPSVPLGLPTPVGDDRYESSVDSLRFSPRCRPSLGRDGPCRRLAPDADGGVSRSQRVFTALPPIEPVCRSAPSPRTSRCARTTTR